MPRLTSLEMWFLGPGDDHSRFEDSFYRQRQSPITLEPYFVCQQTMVDYIMLFAWPWIKRVPKVVIDGAVKDDTKKKWHGLLALTSAEKEIVIDAEAEVERIFQTAVVV